MTKALTISLMAGFCLTTLAADAAKDSPRDFLGVNLAMTRSEARERLDEIGKFERKEGVDQEIWQVRDARFSHLIFGVGEGEKLRYITAVARTDKEAKPVAYEEMGKLKTAREIGDAKIKNFKYQWELPAANGQPSAELLAMGRDPKFLSTVTLKNLEVEREEKD